MAEDMKKTAELYRQQGFSILEGTKIHPSATLTRHYNVADPIAIGRNCIISGNVAFIGHEGSVTIFLDECQCSRLTPILVGDRCFFGWGATIVGPVQIGDRCIVGAGSVVTKSIPSGTVVAGNPAKIVCSTEEYVTKRKKELSISARQADITGSHVVATNYKPYLE